METLDLAVLPAASVRVRLADGSVLTTDGIVRASVVFAPGVEVQLQFHVLNCALGCILGLPFLG